MAYKSFMIDCFIESKKSLKGYATVAIDVIRSTTVAVTVLMTGRRCFYAPSVDSAILLAKQLNNPLLIGEVGGNMPYGFDMNNSPVDVESSAARAVVSRPAIIVSSSGTQLFYELAKVDSAYVSCLRNYMATAEHIAKRYNHISIVGAPTRGEFREEDKLCCAWIGAQLVKMGYEPEDERTSVVLDTWKDAPVDLCAKGNSAEYLRKSGQLKDLYYILNHVNDVKAVFKIERDEIVREF